MKGHTEKCSMTEVISKSKIKHTEILFNTEWTKIFLNYKLVPVAHASKPRYIVWETPSPSGRAPALQDQRPEFKP